MFAVGHKRGDHAVVVAAAAAARHVVQLVVAHLARFGVQKVEIRLGALLGHFHVVFLGYINELFWGLSCLGLCPDFVVKLHVRASLGVFLYFYTNEFQSWLITFWFR